MQSLAHELREVADVLALDFDGTIHDGSVTSPIAPELRSLVEDFVGLGGMWIVASGRDGESLLAELAVGFDCAPNALVVLDQIVLMPQHGTWGADPGFSLKILSTLASAFGRANAEIVRAREITRERLGDVFYDDPLSPFCVDTATVSQLDDVERIVREQIRDPSMCFTRNSTYGRLSRRGIDKGHAVRHICQSFNIAADRVVAAGNDLNDLPMLNRRTARLTAAPASAVEQVRSRVHQLTGGVSHLPGSRGVVDGIRRALELRAPKRADRSHAARRE